ncbi:glutamate synthase central domain-containing protein, partial [Vibrio sp. 10N.222.49.C9]
LYSDMQQLLELNQKHYKHQYFNLCYSPDELSLEQAIRALCDASEQAVRDGAVLLVLSDRNLEKGKLPIPAAMAVGAVQNRLVEAQLRCDTNIIVKTAT